MTYSAILKRGAAGLAIGIALGVTAVAGATTPLLRPVEVRPTGKPAPDEPRLTDTPALDLKAHNTRTDRTVGDETSLRISTLDARVDMAGHMAQTTLTITFANTTGATLEGDFSLQLPADAYVTGYALDVNGGMVEGVLQSKFQAREAYEERVRAGVDPGLAEVDARNMFRTHVFPIRPQSGRTIRVRYVTPLGADSRFELPLSTAYRVDKVSLDISVPATVKAMMDTPDELRSGAPVLAEGRLTMPYSGQNLFLAKRIVVAVKASDDVAVMRHRNGDAFFEFVVPAQSPGKSPVHTLRLYWDASRSHRDDDTQAEAQVVADYIAQVKPQAVDLILFADNAPQTVHFDAPTPDAVKKALLEANYAGATRYAGLAKVLPGRADVCLLVSDGSVTLDAFEAGKWPCRVLTLSASKSAHRDVLRTLAGRNGGVFADLTAGHDAALTQLMMRGPKLWDLTDADGRPVDYAIRPMGTDSYRVFGPAPTGGKLVVDYGTGQQTYTLAQAVDNDGAGALWGASLIDRLNASGAPDREKGLALARRYSVATPDVSFIVLETGGDYARAKIAPPADIDKSIWTAYVQARDQIAKTDAEAKAKRFDAILGQWNGQKDWYAAKYKTLAQAKKAFASEPAPTGTVTETGTATQVAPIAGIVTVTGTRRADAPPPPPPAVQPRETPPSPAMAPPPPLPVPPAPMPSAPGGYISSQNADLSLNASVAKSPQALAGVDIDRSGGGDRNTGMSITTAEWNPERPYLKALNAVKPGDTTGFDTTYHEMEKAFGDTPGFYFDVAEWVFRKGDATRAAAILRNALDLPASDIDTQIIAADRLARYGDYSDAIWLDERIHDLTPEKPQATRNLALVLIEATDKQLAAKTIDRAAAIATYKRALGLLMNVVLTPWNADYDGIEIISLMEANHLVAQLKALGVPAADLADIIDPRLVALMDVDIRITLEWNTDKTDMDLWVDEPSGERVIYNNPRSQLGGRLSNDMTRGYGPEEYLLHMAPAGEYKVLANVYAADVLNRNGATSVTVRLYRDWGRPSETMESFVIELQKGEKGAKPVGTFVRN
ncbi:hypothetical protein AEAC466_20235 [Asticcacaulis sp. AC466]|uniref:VIT domain-containing protein n=1 Tax=Asticcacaulis sp. AC466 TaxID=1282362 RepID=UPI0003C411F4|nr:VIT domain-containing protein [Asticcacaulis sp. AC466]ESQ81753.1 hypothetical protein AEAC466_20235 [Asticcacaulis sp. AC466]